MVKVYSAFIDSESSWNDLHKHIKVLPVEMQNKIMRFHRPQDALASLYGKLLLKKALKEHGLQDDLRSLQVTNYGRPFISDSVDFNISHSGSFVLCAFSNSCKVGIDVEKIQEINLKEFESQLSTEEYNKIIQAPDGCAAFYKIWTMKEALTKADGRGLGVPFKDLKIDSGRIKLGNNIWHLQEVSITNEYRAYLATNILIPEIVVEKVVFDARM